MRYQLSQCSHQLDSESSTTTDDRPLGYLQNVRRTNFEEQRLNAFHLRCIRRILGISWQQHITNDEVLKRVGIPSMFSILAKRRLRWLGHVARMEDGRIPKDMLYGYGELATGSRPAGRPTLRYKDVCKRDLRAGDIAPTDLEALAADRNVWRLTTKSAAVKIEQKLKEQREMKRQRRRVRAASDTLDDKAFVCPTCMQEDLPLADWALQPQ